MPLELKRWIYSSTPVRPITPYIVEPWVVLKEFEKPGSNNNRNVGHHCTNDRLFEENSDHVSEPERGCSSELEEAWAEYEGEKPEHYNEHHVNDSYNYE